MSWDSSHDRCGRQGNLEEPAHAGRAATRSRHEPSLALDTLERLASVRYLQSQGLDRATAIVQAVREAAAGLPVTESLIVDAALSLRLNAEAATGSDLYAEDL